MPTPPATARRLSLRDIAAAVGADIRGDASVYVDRVSSLTDASEGAITFLANRRYRKFLRETQATAVFVRRDDVDNCTAIALVVDDPYLAYAKTAALLNPTPEPVPGIAATAAVDPTALVAADATVADYAVIGSHCVVGARAVIGPHSVLTDDVVIGSETRLSARVWIGARVRIGMRGLIHPGVVIGSDGFGFANDNGRWVKVPQLGTVVIGDDVEIGANTTIDRGALNDTVVGNGVKLDNLIQIAHNVTIGDDTAIAACVGISGSTVIGRRCAIGGGVGILGHLSIVDDVRITPTSLVTRSISKPGTYSSGVPLQESAGWQRNFVRFKQLDRMAMRLHRLERKAGLTGLSQIGDGDEEST